MPKYTIPVQRYGVEVRHRFTKTFIVEAPTQGVAESLLIHRLNSGNIDEWFDFDWETDCDPDYHELTYSDSDFELNKMA
jgi:hypothetical protein